MIQKEKFRLRKEFLARLKSFSEKEKFRQSQNIVKNFFTIFESRAIEKIGFFASTKLEVCTDRLITQSLTAGKRVFLPHTEKGLKELEFYEIRNLNELESGEFGIRVPKKNSPKIEIEELNLLVVPALVFDLKRNRLGRGGGFYDRALQKFKGLSIGLAFDFQVIPQLPTEEWDKKVSQILVG